MRYRPLTSTQVVCPICGQDADEEDTIFGIRSKHCGLWSWDRAPLVDADTHQARKTAHQAFDQIWKSGAMTRSAAYRALAAEMGIPPSECHIKLMTASQCGSVILAAKVIKERIQQNEEVRASRLPAGTRT